MKLNKIKTLDLKKNEAQFGLLLREKENHDNYILINFQDLDKIIQYYDSFKDEFEKTSIHC